MALRARNGRRDLPRPLRFQNGKSPRRGERRSASAMKHASRAACVAVHLISFCGLCNHPQNPLCEKYRSCSSGHFCWFRFAPRRKIRTAERPASLCFPQPSLFQPIIRRTHSVRNTAAAPPAATVNKLRRKKASRSAAAHPTIAEIGPCVE